MSDGSKIEWTDASWNPTRGCSIGAQGMWFRMMLTMHDAKPYGHLVGANGQPLTDKQIVRQCGVTSAELRRYLAEIDSVGVPGRTGDRAYDEILRAEVNGETVDLSPLQIDLDDVIYSRRMMRDQRLRVIRRIAGFLSKEGGRALLERLGDQIPDTRVRAYVPTGDENEKVTTELLELDPEFDWVVCLKRATEQPWPAKNISSFDFEWFLKRESGGTRLNAWKIWQYRFRDKSASAERNAFGDFVSDEVPR